jgi:polysaccharide pyruvyl transferase WcaK-like protein/cell division protein FtsB
MRIGLWGTFDVPNYGDALFPRIGKAEILRRLPHAQVRHFAPLGREHPTRFDGGDTAEALGRYTPERLASLADQLDCVIVGGGEIIHDHDWELAPHYGRSSEELTELAPSRFFIDGLGPELEQECPVVWHAVGLPFDIPRDQLARYGEVLAARPYVSVRDETSRERLVAAGVEHVALVPDPAVLVPRILSPDLLDRRLRYLRAIGAFPVRGEALVVQGSRVLLDSVDQLAPAVQALATTVGVPVVLVETGPTHGDGEFAEALQARLGIPVHRVSDVGVEDVAAAIVGSAGFVGNSLHGNITAFAFGKPHVILGMSGGSKLKGFARLADMEASLALGADGVAEAFRSSAERGPRTDVLRRLQAGVDEHFDRLVEIAATAARRRPPREAPASVRDLERQFAALRRAFEVRGRRLAIQRWRMADRVAEVERTIRDIRERLEETEAENEELRARKAALEREVAGKEDELDRLMNTRTFRYTAPFRRTWGRLRGRGDAR